jgi:hypothetical protein
MDGWSGEIFFRRKEREGRQGLTQRRKGAEGLTRRCNKSRTRRVGNGVPKRSFGTRTAELGNEDACVRPDGDGPEAKMISEEWPLRGLRNGLRAA